jgi:hypothetical protein
MTDILIILIALFGGYEIYYGFWAYRQNGFPFYWVTGLMIGLPFLVAAVLTLFSKSFRAPWLEGSVLLIFVLGELWKAWKKRQARKKYPLQWARWERILKERELPLARNKSSL